MAVRPLLIAFAVLLFASRAAAAVPTITHDGRGYVDLHRLATTLKTRLEATAESTQARLRTPGHVVTFTRNWSRVMVDGAPVVLDAPVRVKGGVWLVPETFLSRVLPRLSAPARAASTRVANASPAAFPRPVLTPPGGSVPTRTSLEDVRSRSYPSFTRIVIETSGPVAHRVEESGGKEMVIRLLSLGGEAQQVDIRDGFVAEARVERAGPDAMLKVVADEPFGELRVSRLLDPHRLVLDFHRRVEVRPRERREARPGLRVIVLDAGHGGHDSGATGPSGLMEKDLVLDVTRRVAKLVEDRLEIKVRLSRDGDQFVPLRERTSFANRERADLFVSIHANAHREAASEGVETYFLSSEATDSAARQVAALENGALQLESPASRARADVVKAILWDLAQSEFQHESSRLAEVVQDAMTHALRIPNRGVKQAGFYVLGGAAMPAVLIEIGFVTNPKEERKLKDSRYRDEIARAIFTGLAEYKRQWEQRTRAARAR